MVNINSLFEEYKILIKKIDIKNYILFFEKASNLNPKDYNNLMDSIKKYKNETMASKQPFKLRLRKTFEMFKRYCRRNGKQRP